MARLEVEAGVTCRPASAIAGAGPKADLLAAPSEPVYAHATLPEVDARVQAAVTVLPGQLEVVGPTLEEVGT